MGSDEEQGSQNLEVFREFSAQQNGSRAVNGKINRLCTSSESKG